MKIIVTGNAGFIASHISDKYRELGHTVIDVDIRHKKPLDITDADAMMKLFMKEKPDIVNHHAALISVVKSVDEPLATFQTNVMGTMNLLLAAGACGTVKKFIFPSTAAAYGTPTKIPVVETAPKIPLSPYGLAKVMAEDAIRFYSRTFGFQHIIFRYANVYGPRQDPKGEAGVVAIFTGLMHEGKQPTIFGDGTKSRDYCYIEDIVKANVIALRRGKNETMNLGWGKKITDQKIFDEIAKNIGYKARPIYAPYRKGEAYEISLAGAKAHATIGWKPTVTFEQGIAKYIRATEL